MVKAQSNQQPATAATALRVEGSGGKIRKNGPEQVEIQLYLSKLKELVPHMPKNRKVSKLEVIQHAIDYICDLQWALETHPAARNPALVTAAGLTTLVAQQQQRQPLGSLAPLSNTCAVQEINQPVDKPVSSDCDVRTIPCCSCLVADD